MKKIKESKGRKEFNGKIIDNILGYIGGLGGILNKNCESIALKNPIGVTCAYEQLIELQKEIEGVEINIEDIKIENVFEGLRVRNEVENFIRNHGDATILHRYLRDYNRMKANEELEVIYPTSERVERREFLELEINKMIQTNSKLVKISPSLVKDKEKDIKILQKELISIIESLDVPSREELRMHCYLGVMNYINQVKSMISENVDYISKLMRKVNNGN